MLLDKRNMYGNSTKLVPIPEKRKVTGWVRNPNSIHPHQLKHFSATKTATHVATVNAQDTYAAPK